MRRQRLWIVAWSVYAAGIFVLSGLELPARPSLGGVFGWDKLFHAVEFAVFYGLAWLALGRRPGPALLATLLFAGTDELHQAFVPLRVASAADFLADAVGALCAALAIAPSRRSLLANVGRRILVKAPTEKEK